MRRLVLRDGSGLGWHQQESTTISGRIERRYPLVNSSQRSVALFVCILLFAAPDARAQVTDLTGRIFLHFNGINQAGSEEFRETLPFTIYSEEASFDSVHDIRRGGTIDAGGFIGLWRSLAVGATYTQLSKSDSTRVTGSVPHPLFFDDFRQIAPESLALTHREQATHVHAAWIVPIVDRVELALIGGLSFFHVTQGVIADVDVSETVAPFTLVNVDAIHTQEQTASAVGGNIGADVLYLLTDQIGAGAFVRYAGASADLPTQGGDVSIRLGGVQAGAGIRVRLQLPR
ncbi:MAG: hypothetical protein CL477_03280 [Acidobacteria bacterium]|jgi:hypothetical protein|nr:hypothetical protein [Acidobacteriota bacterium]|tara:strand:+ start:7172 stop:8035 length:864 start_codon:yes stop_codon:yes gene_type:complete